MPNSYEHSYQHDLDNVIDASDAVLAIGTEKVDTTTLKDRSLNNNDATIHEAMPSNGYFIGRRFTSANENYLDCGNDSSLNITNNFTIDILFKLNSLGIVHGLISKGRYNTPGWDFSTVAATNKLDFRTSVFSGIDRIGDTELTANVVYASRIVYDGTTLLMFLNGLQDGVWFESANVPINSSTVKIGANDIGSIINPSDAEILYSSIYTNGNHPINIIDFFNTLARLSLYSHNFERYPNSDTSLTSVFPYTSGIITSGSFNKTDGLKCTSAGQIIFSNSFEFDGSEYITLIINGVEYSGTTTITQGTITVTIAQGSNDITIDMGTGDVLPDIRVQFREEV